MATIAANIQQVQERIAKACVLAKRDVRSVTLLAVSKTFPAAAVREAIACGLHRFGENYVQEALEKIESLSEERSRLEWHMIGPLQSNKTRPVAEHFDWVHSVDRIKIAQRLSEQRPSTLPPLQVCLQVNISGGASERGFKAGGRADAAPAIAGLPRLALRGLMAIPEPAGSIDAQREPHRALRELRDSLNAGGLALDTLSMGMTADLEAAVLEGATMVRVGTAIFGQRDYG